MFLKEDPPISQLLVWQISISFGTESFITSSQNEVNSKPQNYSLSKLLVLSRNSILFMQTD